LRLLDIIKSLCPLIVVAGHKVPATHDADPRTILDALRTYNRDFDKGVAESAMPEEVIEKMTCLQANAFVFGGNLFWQIV